MGEAWSVPALGWKEEIHYMASVGELDSNYKMFLLPRPSGGIVIGV